MSQGVLQFDMWRDPLDSSKLAVTPTKRWRSAELDPNPHPRPHTLALTLLTLTLLTLTLLTLTLTLTLPLLTLTLPRWDWAELKSRIAKHGVRNSLLLAPMPTASTAQEILTLTLNLTLTTASTAQEP